MTHRAGPAYDGPRGLPYHLVLTGRPARLVALPRRGRDRAARRAGHRGAARGAAAVRDLFLVDGRTTRVSMTALLDLNDPTPARAGLPQPQPGRRDPADLVRGPRRARAATRVAGVGRGRGCAGATSSLPRRRRRRADRDVGRRGACCRRRARAPSTAGHAQRLHLHDARLPDRAGAAHPAPGRGGGVRLPGVPDCRRSAACSARGGWRSSHPRSSSASPTASGRASRSSSTGSPSASSPASWSCSPEGSRPASPCTCSTTGWPSGSRSPSATWRSTLNPTGGSWWSIPVTLTQSLVYLVPLPGRGPPDGLAPPDRADSRPFWWPRVARL